MRFPKIHRVLFGITCLTILMGPAVWRSAHTVTAAEQSPCGLLTVEKYRSDACDAEIAKYPVPSVERPTQHNAAEDGDSRPRAIVPPQGTPYPIGWLRREWNFSDKPGKDPVIHKETFMERGVLVLIYAKVRTRTTLWLLIGKDRWLPADNISVLYLPKRPEKVSGRWITLDLTQQTLVALVDDTPVFATLIASGLKGQGYTREGLFHIYARARYTTFRGPPWEKIPKYVIPNVPYTMFFDKDVALHGAYWHNTFGIPRSHGCVNIPVADEAWLWNWVGETADQWGPDNGSFHLKHPDKAPFVFVYKSAKVTP